MIEIEYYDIHSDKYKTIRYFIPKDYQLVYIKNVIGFNYPIMGIRPLD